VTIQGRSWAPDAPLRAGGPGSAVRAPLHASDVLRLEVPAGTPDSRVERAVRAACRAARRTLPHLGKIHAHAELAPDLGAPRTLTVTLRLDAQILHAEDREACAAAFAAAVRRKLG
jgi:hypothetical protein